jgi:hypothetical protein
MATQFRWLLLILIGMFACATGQEVAVPTTPPSTPTLIPTTTAPTSVAVQAAPAGQPLHGYVNVTYTQANGDLIGRTQRAQLLNIYATW